MIAQAIDCAVYLVFHRVAVSKIFIIRQESYFGTVQLLFFLFHGNKNNNKNISLI